MWSSSPRVTWRRLRSASHCFAARLDPEADRGSRAAVLGEGERLVAEQGPGDAQLGDAAQLGVRVDAHRLADRALGVVVPVRLHPVGPVFVAGEAATAEPFGDDLAADDHGRFLVDGGGEHLDGAAALDDVEGRGRAHLEHVAAGCTGSGRRRGRRPRAAPARQRCAARDRSGRWIVSAVGRDQRHSVPTALPARSRMVGRPRRRGRSGCGSRRRTPGSVGLRHRRSRRRGRGRSACSGSAVRLSPRYAASRSAEQ